MLSYKMHLKYHIFIAIHLNSKSGVIIATIVNAFFYYYYYLGWTLKIELPLFTNSALEYLSVGYFELLQNF